MTATYIGLRTWRYRPPTTSRSVGATGAGVPAPSTTKRAKACSSAATPATTSAAPRMTSQVGGSFERQPVSSHGTTPPMTPGATTRNTRLPRAALRLRTGPLGGRRFPELEPGALGVDRPAEAP